MADDDEDFWKRSTQLQAIEERRRRDRDEHANAWRRNVLWAIAAMLLVGLVTWMAR